MKYLSTFEIAEKWGISPRRVGILCNQDRIPGAQRAGSRWIIPEEIQKRNEVICLWNRNISLVILHSKDYKI